MTRGRKRLPWIKLWFEMLGDPKMTRLSSAEKWYWVGILLLAGQSPIRGKLMLTDTEPMSMEDVAAALSLPPKEVPLLESCIAKLEKLRSVAWNNVCLEVIHFKDRQEVYPSDVPDDELTPNKLRINSELTPTEVEGRGERKKKDIPPLPDGKGVRKKRADPLADPRVKEILDEMKKFFGYPEKTEKDPIPNYGVEGQAIKRMLTRRFTCDEILACWRSKVSRRGGEFVSMKWVNQDIGDFARGGEALPASPEEGQNQAMIAESGISTQKGGADEQREPKGREPPAHKRDPLQAFRDAGGTVILSGEEAEDGNEDK